MFINITVNHLKITIMDNILPIILIAIVIAIVILLILREVNCWYWKINQRISLMEKQNTLLEKLVSNDVPIKKNDIKIEDISEQPTKNTQNNFSSEETPKFQKKHFTKKVEKKRKLIYWIYGILILVFLGINFLNTGGKAKKTDWKDMKTMLVDKDVQKLVLVNKEVAEIYLKPEALKKEKYKDVQNTTNTFGQKTPQFYYNVASPDIFIQQVQDVQKGNNDPVYVESETRHNWGGEILSWVFPILLIIIGILIFITIPTFQKHKQK